MQIPRQRQERAFQLFQFRDWRGELELNLA